MRVTNSMMANSHLNNLQTNLQRLDKINLQMDTSKQINKLSDDPFRAIKIINLQSEIEGMDKYNYNCDEIKGFLESTDSALNELGSISMELKEALSQAATGTNGPDEVKSIEKKVNELIKEAGQVLNLSYGRKHILGGTITDEKPFETIENSDGSVTIQVNSKHSDPSKLDEEMEVELSPGISINYNVNFKDFNGQVNITSLNDISKAFVEGDQEKLGKLIKNVDSFISDIVNARAVAGSKTSTIDVMREKNEENILTMKGELSQKQDVDVMQKYIELNQAQMTYSASLQAGAKIIQPTLLDYLR
jgi:flagellar hook-associated protein 3 FlgL